jgi:hypothetical protein
MQNQFSLKPWKTLFGMVLPTEVTLAFLLVGIPVIGGGIAYFGSLAFKDNLLNVILAIILVLTLLTEQYFSRRHLPSMITAVLLALFVLYTPFWVGEPVLLVLLGIKVLVSKGVSYGRSPG